MPEPASSGPVAPVGSIGSVEWASYATKRKGVRRPRRRNGYVEEWCPERRRYVYQHRLVMERELGRRLERREIVHHLNSDRLDNRPENLSLMASHTEHARHHQAHGGWGWPKGKPKPWLRRPPVECPVCGAMFVPKRRSTPEGRRDTATCSCSCGQRFRYSL